MPELTAETVRSIVAEIVTESVQELRREVNDGFERIITTMQTFQDENNDRFAEVDGRLDYHNKRIAKLERLNGLRT